MRIFEYSNAIGEQFFVPFSTKEEQIKAWLKMFKYYNSNSRSHPLWELFEEDDKNHLNPCYLKAKKGHIPSIKKLLNKMWNETDLQGSFYGKIRNVK